MIETNLGNTVESDTNGKRDIFQCLDPRNPPLNALSGKNPEGSLQGLPKDGYGAIKNLYVNGIFDKEAVTPTISICFGIRWFAYKSMSSPYNEQDDMWLGVVRYNGGGDTNYVIKTKVALYDIEYFLEYRNDIPKLKEYLKFHNINY